MTSAVGRAVATTAVIGGGALAAGGIAGAAASPDESQVTDLTLAVVGGIGLAGSATALATTGRAGTIARVVGLGATALAGVAALVGLAGGSRRHETVVGDQPTPTPLPTPTPTTDPTPTPAPLTPKQAYEQAMEAGRARVDTVPDTAASLGGSDALLAGIHPRYGKIFRKALNEKITPDVRPTGTVDWAAVATTVDANRDGRVTFDERMASGHMRAHSISAYAVGVAEKLRAGRDTSPAARVRAGRQVLEEWNETVQPGHNPGESYMLAQTLLDDAGIARAPDDSADWTRLARHLESKLTSYGS